MCGIVGYFSKKLDRWDESAVRQRISVMVQALKHRGPDNQDVWTFAPGGVALGHCRLAIIDLSTTGCQPRASHNGRYVISFNGEIYNYLELARELERAGTRFEGKSDTEVLIEAISQWGLERTLKRLLGMFAFALWDHDTGTLTLARDRAGKKPLYYYLDESQRELYFASEIKALRAVPELSLSYNEDAIYQYLTFGFVPSPETIYQKVVEPPAGHWVRFGPDLKVESQPYWQIAWDKKKRLTFAQAVEEAHALLKEAVKIRLRADVPVGCFLSGGIDSGLLTALASTQMDCPLQTFTVSFSDKEGTFDEAPLADMVAEKYGTNHRVLLLSPKLEDVLPQVARTYDEPLADSSIIPSYCISQEAAKFVKVVLNGEGGDELFGGYRRQRAMQWYSQAQPFLALFPESFWRRVVDLLPMPRGFRSRYAFVHRIFRGMVKDPFERYIIWSSDGFNEAEKSRLYQQQPPGIISSPRLLYKKFSVFEHLSPSDQFMAMDFLLTMHDDMLVKMDMATMAHSLEGRNPFLDHRIVEWAASLQPSVKFQGLDTKPILRTLAQRYLPPEVVAAPKRGFEIPLVKWLRQDLKHMVWDLCLAPNGIVRRLFVQKDLEDLLAGKHHLDPARWANRVFILFMLVLWEGENT